MARTSGRPLFGVHPSIALAWVVAVATVARLVLGRVFFGFHTGDDLEIIQASLMRAIGWPYAPWEIRNLFVSDILVAPFVALAAALGVESVRTLVWVASWPFVVLASVNIVLVFKLAEAHFESQKPALVAATLYAFHWLPLGYGSMPYPRTASTTCILVAALLLPRTLNRPWFAGLAGGLIGIAWAIRYSEVIFLLPLLAGILLWVPAEPKRRIFAAAAALCGFVVISIFTVGLEDWLTWGRPFASLIAFAKYTLLEKRASSLVTSQPWYWYLWRLPKWLPLPLGLFLGRSRLMRYWQTPVAFIVLPLVVLSYIHHKQLRYLQGIVPFVVLLAVAAAWSYWKEGRRRAAAVLVAVTLLWDVTAITFLQRKSMAAVGMAETLSTRIANGREICLSQAWAYGNDLYVGRGVPVRDVPYPVAASAIEELGERCAFLALYREDLKRHKIEQALAEEGFVHIAVRKWGKSKPVVAFAAGQHSAER